MLVDRHEVLGVLLLPLLPLLPLTNLVCRHVLVLFQNLLSPTMMGGLLPPDLCPSSLSSIVASSSGIVRLCREKGLKLENGSLDSDLRKFAKLYRMRNNLCCGFRDDRRPKNGCFFGKLPNGLDPPPRPFLEITLRFFPENPLGMRKFAMKFFGLAMTPPPLPPFLEITLRFFLQNIPL